nr:MAG TPA: hypothetical protein [Caudoviricetes sp.]
MSKVLVSTHRPSLLHNHKSFKLIRMSDSLQCLRCFFGEKRDIGMCFGIEPIKKTSRWTHKKTLC